MWNRDEYFFFEVTAGGAVKTNVQHLISCLGEDINKAPQFRLGYDGHGPNELAANILWLMEVAEGDCKAYASRFRDEVLHKLPREGGRLYKWELDEWIMSKVLERSHYYNSHAG